MSSPAPRGPLPWIIIVVVLAAMALAVAAVVTTLRLKPEIERNQALRHEADSLRVEILGVRDTIQAAKMRAQNAERRRDEMRDGIDDGTIRSMRQVGFSDPVRDIKRDLMKHRELIPYSGSLGGTMAFYSEKDIRVLNDHWVFAEFDDGHSVGWMLLRWRFESTKIYWKRIDSYMD
jgi:hypothetical protein